MVSLARQALGSDQPLFAQMAEVARPRIAGPGVVSAEIARGLDPESADGRECPRFRPAQRALPVAVIAHKLTVSSPRKVEIAHEDVARVDRPLVSVALWPPRVIAVPPVAVGVAIAWTAAELACVALAIARVVAANIVRAVRPIVVVARVASISAVPRLSPAVAIAGGVIARVVAPPRVVKHEALRRATRRS